MGCRRNACFFSLKGCNKPAQGNALGVADKRSLKP
jgi:hypothetical protein